MRHRPRHTALSYATLTSAAIFLAAACGSSSTSNAPGSDAATPEDARGHADSGSHDARTSGDGSTQADGGAHDAATGDGTAPPPDSSAPPRDATPDVPMIAIDAGDASTATGAGTPGASCATTVVPIDVSSPTTVIGTGAGTCTESALTTAIAKGGIITFDCGTAASTIPITTTLVLRTDIATTLDGGSLVTLDGGNTTQLFKFTGPNFQTTKTTVTFQHMRFTNARATGSMPFPASSAPCSSGYELGGGGVIQISDGVLHVIDSVFETNHGAHPGPDIAGGAIYGIGSLDITVVGSKFLTNDASNGGAIGSLFSDLTVLTSTFAGNQALGSGGNATNSTCPVVGGQRETGSGGNGGAISIDGGETFTVKLCGDLFSKNVSGTGALGGAVFRTPDGATQETDIDQSTFDSNSGAGAGALYFHNSMLVITNSTLSNNHANGSGAIQADGTVLNLTNVTLYGNYAATSPGGAIALFGNSGTFTNVTFAKNHCDGASGDGFGVDLFGSTAFTMNNCLFDSATQADPNNPMACQTTGTGTHDFQWPSTHSTGTNPDNPCVTGIDFADPQLGTLGNNGGPTQTVAPASGSPAATAGQSCPAKDQRGHTRPASGCTAGAYELN